VDMLAALLGTPSCHWNCSPQQQKKTIASVRDQAVGQI